MFNKLRSSIASAIAPTPVVPQPEAPTRKRLSAFSTDHQPHLERLTPSDVFDAVIQRNITRTADKDIRKSLGAMDAAVTHSMDATLKAGFNLSNQVPNVIMNWYGAQSFIGYQMCSIIAQQWFVFAACNVPAIDAASSGYKITVNDETQIPPAVLDEIKKADVRFNINKHLEELVTFGRMFGIRIVKFDVHSDDPEYYEKPFNINGVTPGSYKGIVQIDPYWITPELDMRSAGDPAYEYFYEPTWWRVNGIRIHRTHLVIMRYCEVADILKPTYLYGGIPLPQQIYERVYAAERTANEGPKLALTKRTKVVKCDIGQAILKPDEFQARVQLSAEAVDNYGQQFIDLDDEVQQFDTTLADLDAVIMTQFQLACAIAKVPSVELLRTQPKGFNSSGDFEYKSYHGVLKSIQSHDMTPLLERHHLLLIRSEIAPNYTNGAIFEVNHVWNPLESLSGKEKAEINKFNAEAGAQLIASGAIDGQDERERLVNDENSGYQGMGMEPGIEPQEKESDPETYEL